MKVALWVALFMCVLMSFLGVVLWFVITPFIAGLLISVVAICPAIAFGALAIDALREEY